MHKKTTPAHGHSKRAKQTTSTNLRASGGTNRTPQGQRSTTTTPLAQKHSGTIPSMNRDDRDDRRNELGDNDE
jgi:hypothetical protein